MSDDEGSKGSEEFNDAVESNENESNAGSGVSRGPNSSSEKDEFVEIGGENEKISSKKSDFFGTGENIGGNSYYYMESYDAEENKNNIYNGDSFDNDLNEQNSYKSNSGNRASLFSINNNSTSSAQQWQEKKEAEAQEGVDKIELNFKNVAFATNQLQKQVVSEIRDIAVEHALKLPLPAIVRDFLEGKTITKNRILKLVLSKKTLVPLIIFALFIFVAFMSQVEHHDPYLMYTISNNLTMVQNLDKGKVTSLEIRINFRQLGEENVNPENLAANSYRKRWYDKSILNRYERALLDAQVPLLPHPFSNPYGLNATQPGQEPTVCFSIESLTAWPQQIPTLEGIYCTLPSLHAGFGNDWVQLIDLYSFSNKTHSIRVLFYTNSPSFLSFKLILTQMGPIAQYQVNERLK